MLLFAASFAVSWIPGIGGLLAHPLDAMRHRSNANYELNTRAKFYAEQVGTTLGVSSDRVGRGELLMAAHINPNLRRVVDEVEKTRKKENRESLLMNTGVTAASVVGAGGIAKVASEGLSAFRAVKTGSQIVQQTAGTLAGGAVAGLFSKNEIQAHELIEAAQKDLIRARAEGLDAKAAINPQMTFMIRVAQDEVLSKEINTMTKQRFGKPLHQLDSQQIGLVMNHYPALANSTLREAKAIANGDMDIRDLVGGAPNMGAGFAGPMARSDNAKGSFVDRLTAQREASRGPQGVSA